MTERINTAEASQAVRLTLEHLKNCSKFFGLTHDKDTGEDILVTYKSPDISEFANFSEAGEKTTLKVEGDKVLYRERPDCEWQEVPSAEEIALIKIGARSIDPRKILANLEDVFVGPFGLDQKVIRAFLNVRGLGLPEDLIAHIEEGTKIAHPHSMDVDTYSRLQRPGSLRPLAEFYIKQGYWLTRMTIGRIMPGDEDSRTVEFKYK